MSQSESWKLIDGLSRVVLDQVFDDAKMFSVRGWSPDLLFNISALSLQDVYLPDMLLARTKEAGLSPTRIIIEITESGLSKNLAAALDILARFRMLGFGLSIDAFGTALSVTRNLRRIPASELKIDKKIIRVMDRDRDARIVAHKTIETGHELGMKVVAAGVETQAQLRILRELHCDLAQGYLFAPPMLAADIVVWRKTTE